MSKTYSGPTPVTKDDFKMAKDHLKSTYKLNKQKIKDHQNALKDAQKSGNPKSANYNRSHLQGHQQDIKQIKTSLKTVNSLKPAIIMPVKKSAGLANFASKKKLMASALVRSK